ncbi:MAG: OmpH family outer membrane protein [Bacteroidetes bacterium]|nr:OmpH family outer membrane protein [Bacteroidota bacterium]
MTPHRIFTAILALAIVILYYLHFKSPAAETSTGVIMAAPVATNIVYVNSDSLLDNFSFYKNKKAEFAEKESQIKNHLQAESERLQKDAADYQDRAAMMSEGDRAKKEEELMQRQQSLMKKKDDMLGAFEEEQSRFSESLYSKLSAYLKEYNKGKNYTFILGYQKGGGILFANDSLDITSQVLEGLNKESEEK